MPLEPPDPVKIAAALRDLLPALDAQRQQAAALVNAAPTNAAYRDAYGQLSAAVNATAAAINDLDPPR